jgi:hypothetical protein
MNRLPLVGLAIVAACGPPTGSAPTPMAWVGCYTLVRGPWEVAPESLFAALPGRRLRLTDHDVRKRGDYNDGPEIPVDRSVRRAMFGKLPAIWWVTDSNGILVSTGGLAGIAVELQRSAAGLVGSATGFNDILKPDSSGQFH